MRPYVLPTALLVSACLGSPPDDAADRAAIAATNEVWAVAYKQADAAALRNVVTEDFTSMRVDGNDLNGREAYVETSARSFEKSETEYLELQIVTEGLEIRGDFAYEFGHDISVLRRKDAPTAAPDTTLTRYVTFWRRQPDGSWRVARDFTVGAP